jgi:methylmalonyl-CoA mutase, N-terminal domain
MFDWCSRQRAQVQPDLDLGLPHSRGGRDGGPGARVHAPERLRVRGAGDRAWARRRPVRARLSFFFDVHNDFFEEIAKLRAARRIWARGMKEKYGAKNPESWRLRTHAQTAGVSLTAQQPENNIVRVAYQAMAAALGGTQSLHTNSMDETLALPTEKAVRIALRTQQILAHESGVPNTIDPLAGSYYVEALTDELEREALELFDEIDGMGGVVPGIEAGWFQREIAESAMRQQRDIESAERVIVGVNRFTEGSGSIEIDTLKIDSEVEARQVARMKALRERRDDAKVEAALGALEGAARDGSNVVPFILDCARADCTLYEIRHAMENVFGAYKEPVFF